MVIADIELVPLQVEPVTTTTLPWRERKVSENVENSNTRTRRTSRKKGKKHLSFSYSGKTIKEKKRSKLQGKENYCHMRKDMRKV